MPAKVFISCGQGSPGERNVARKIKTWLKSKGFNPYVAIEVQSILDLNAGIIAELKTSDYFMLINFKREEVLAKRGVKFRRSSLYTNQELAIAYALGFDHMLLLNEKGARKEGVFHFMVSNIPEFSSYEKILPLVRTAVAKAEWSPAYTRHLTAANLRFSPPMVYNDDTGSRMIIGLRVDILNDRPDLGAIGCVARLARFGAVGCPMAASPDTSSLKAIGHPTYHQTIWPKSLGGFDLLGILVSDGSQVLLSSALDLHPRQPIIQNPGQYRLEYEVFSQGFMPLSFAVRLDLTGNFATARASFA